MKKLYLIMILLILPLTSSQLQIFNSGKETGENIINIDTTSSTGNNNTVTVNNTQCWLGDCLGMRNIFNQILNTTSNVVFNTLEVYNVSQLAYIRTGRNDNEQIGIRVDDSNGYIMLTQDLDEGSPHRIFFDINVTGANSTKADYTFRINGTEVFRVNYTDTVAPYFRGDGSRLTNISMNYTNLAFLNNTQTFTGDNNFRNITAKNISSSEWIRGKEFQLNNNGGAIFPETSTRIRTVDVGGGVVSIPAISFTGGAGLTVGAMLDGLYVIPQQVTTSARILLSKNGAATDTWVFQNNNNTGYLELIRENPFSAGNIPSIINATGHDIISNHQSYNMTSLRNLDTTYKNNNTNGRPIRVSMDFDSEITGDISNAGAYVVLYVNGTEVDSEGMIDVSLGASTGKWRFSVEGDVQPDLTYSFNSTVVASASVTKRAVWIYVD